jgi:enamine deaminase RidA (YjgF/YER057c/UK114 family)
MPHKFNPDTIYPPLGKYFNAVEVSPGERLVFSAGIIGMTPSGELPEDPKKQIGQAWQNVAAFLKGAGMTRANLVKLTMLLTRREHIEISRDARIKALGQPQDCAVTELIVQVFDPALYIEIDVYAAR